MKIHKGVVFKCVYIFKRISEDRTGLLRLLKQSQQDQIAGDCHVEF